MGVGFGLMVLIGVAFGNVSAGFGVGGFLVIMGLAFFINSRFEQPRNGAPPAASRSTSSPVGPAGTMAEPRAGLESPQPPDPAVSPRIHRRHPYRYSPAAPIQQVMAAPAATRAKH